MEKLSMGEYTEAVWAAYAVAFMVLGAISWVSMRSYRKAKRTLGGD